MQNIACGNEFLPVNVDRVTHGLERIKADSHRQDNAVKGQTPGQPPIPHQCVRVFRKEEGILEKTQGGDVGRQGNKEYQTSPARILMDSKPGVEVNEAGRHQQRDEPPIPPPVEEQGKEDDVPPPKIRTSSSQRPSREKNCRKNQEFKRIE